MESPKPKSKYVLSSGVFDTKGRRDTMEDTHVVFDEVDSFKDSKQVAYYGCFDGHGGVCFFSQLNFCSLSHTKTQTAKMIGDILHTTVFNRQEFTEGNYVDALEKAFEEADRIVVADSLENNYMNGCTAVVGVVVDGVLHIANIGDSEGILVSVRYVPQDIVWTSLIFSDEKVSVENLTFPHKASVASEKARIESLGGYVFFNRVFGSLAVSRAFGDSKYKQPKTTQNYVSYLPATKTIELNSAHRYRSFFYFLLSSPSLG
jgi:serine/threonine protein phosphatase PrpC